MKELIILLSLLVSFTSYGQTAVEIYNKGNDKSNAKDFAGALKDYTEAIKLDPAYTDAWYNRGVCKMFLNEHKAAIADFNKAIELRPSFVNAYVNRGVTKIKLEDINGAVDDFDAAIKINPNNTSALFIRGQLKLQTGDKDAGCADLRKAKELGESRAEKLLSQYCEGKTAESAENKASESLRLDWPDSEGWKVANRQEDKEKKMIELLRNKETFDNWTEIGTMIVYPFKAVIPIDAYMQLMYEQAKKTCPSATFALIEKNDAAKYPWLIFKIECATDKPESQVWQIILGDNDLFVNFRGVKQKTLPDKLKAKWTAFFKTAKVVKG